MRIDPDDGWEPMVEPVSALPFLADLLCAVFIGALALLGWAWAVQS